MKLKIVLYIIVVLFLVVSTVSAHPGRTDSNGGHTCKTNCEKWGLKDGEYHYNNRPMPVSNPTPTPSPTPTPTPAPTPTVTLKSTPTLTPTSTVTSTPSPTPKSTLTSIAALNLTEEDKFVNYSMEKPTDTQNQMIDKLNQTDKNISHGEEKKNWFEKLITWLFK